MEETFESIDRDTKEKVFYYLAFGFVAIQIVLSFYLLIFEMFILFLKTITFSLDSANDGELLLLKIHPGIILFGVGGGVIASFIFGFFDKLRLTGAVIMILLAGFCNAFVFLLIGKVDNGVELTILSTVLSVIILIFITLYFRKRDAYSIIR